MNTGTTLEDLLSIEISRRNTDLIAGLVIQKPELFDRVMEIFLRNEEPVSRRAAWVADTVAEQMPELLLPWLEKIATSLPGFTHDGMKRMSLRMLMRHPLPESIVAQMINLCFDWLTSPPESISVKVYSMEIIYNLSCKEPDLKQELADSIEWRISEESPGFRNRGLKLLKKLNKELRDLQYNH